MKKGKHWAVAIADGGWEVLLFSHGVWYSTLEQQV